MYYDSYYKTEDNTLQLVRYVVKKLKDLKELLLSPSITIDKKTFTLIQQLSKIKSLSINNPQDNLIHSMSFTALKNLSVSPNSVNDTFDIPKFIIK